MGITKIRTDIELEPLLIQSNEKIWPSITNRPHLALKDEINFLDAFIKTYEGTEYLDALNIWNSSTPYSKGVCISYNSKNYISKQNSNLNHTPAGVTDSWWKVSQVLEDRFVRNYGTQANIEIKPNGTNTTLTLANAAVSVTGTLSVSAGATLSSTLGVTGATTLSSTLGVTGATTLSSTLGVTGNTTLTGDLAVNGGDISSSSGTFNLINSTVSTVNFAGASTSLTIASTTGTTTVRNRLNVSSGIGFNSGNNTLTWNSDDGTLDLLMNGGNVSQQIGLETYFRIKNTSGSIISNGSVVIATGSVGNSGVISGGVGKADGNIHSRYFLGIATESIPVNGFGYVTEFGLVRGVQTNGANYSETWSEGDVLYASSTISGGLTKVEPTSPHLKIPVAMVIYVHATNGSLFVRVSHGGKLEDLHNTKIVSKATGDLITYNSTTSSWENLAGAAINNVLLSGGAGVKPSYGKVALTTHVSGTLPVANGGTGVTSSTGSGNNVLSTSPTLVTPVLGAATATSLNVGNLTLSNGAVFALANSAAVDGTLTTTSTAEAVISSFPAGTFRTFEILIQATKGSEYHSTKLMGIHDGTNVNVTEFGTLWTGSSLFTVRGDITTGNVNIIVTPSSATSTVFKYNNSLINI